MKWDTNPVLVSFAPSPTPVWQIPFPAITICSETKLAPQFRQIFLDCTWAGFEVSCTDLFSPILTEDGLCFTFNMLNRDELFTNAVFLHDKYMEHDKRATGWSLENGYAKTTKKNTFPRRFISAGGKSGLELKLRTYEKDMDYMCGSELQGFKVLLHHPAEMPRMGSQYLVAPLNQEIIIAVKPDIITTSQGLRDYDPHRRQCFFANERNLYFFQNYTQQNCQLECIANYTRERCGCVAFYMPHEESTSICGSGSRKCIFEAEHELIEMQVESGLHNYDYDAEGNSTKPQCDCLPDCASINYIVGISQADYNWRRLFKAYRFNMSELTEIHVTRITLFFKDMQFITSERNELFGQTDFLANCGGLLGLFTGFSILSIVEIIYFLSLRLICNVKKYGVHFWSGSKTLLENEAYLHK